MLFKTFLGGFVGSAFGAVDLTNGNLNANGYAGLVGSGHIMFRYFVGNPHTITGAPSDIVAQHDGCVGFAASSHTGTTSGYARFFQVMLTTGYNYGSNLYVRGGCTTVPASIGWQKIF